MRDVFYIAAVTIVQAPCGCAYYVHTNAGTSMYMHYDELPRLAQIYITKNLVYAEQSFPFVTIVSNGGVVNAG